MAEAPTTNSSNSFPHVAPILLELLRTHQAAALMELSERHFKSMANAGKIGPLPVWFGKAKRWPRAEMVAWIRNGSPRRERWLKMLDERPEMLE